MSLLEAEFVRLIKEIAADEKSLAEAERQAAIYTSCIGDKYRAQVKALKESIERKMQLLVILRS